MIYEELYIGAKKLDIKDISIVRTYTSPYFSDQEKAFLDTTLTIQLPHTENNRLALEYLMEVDMNTSFPYTVHSVNYIVDGFQIIKDGEAKILSAYEIQIVYGYNRANYVPLTKKKLNEIKVNGTTITSSNWIVNWDKAHYQASGKKYRYIDYISGKRVSDVHTIDSVVSPKVNPPELIQENMKEMTMHPFILFQNILDLINADNTHQIDFSRLSARLTNKGLILNGNKDDYTYSHTYITQAQTETDSPFLILNDVVHDGVIQITNSFIRNQLGAGSEFKTTLNLMLDIAAYSASAYFPRLILFRSYFDFEAGETVREIVKEIEHISQSSYYTYFDTTVGIDISSGDAQAYDYFITISIPAGIPYSILSGGSINISYTLDSSVYRFLDYYGNSVGRYNCLMNMPDLTEMDFIKQMLIHTCGFVGKDFEFYFLEDFKTNLDNRDVYDWSGRITNVKDSKYQLNSNAQKNYIKFNNDKDLTPDRKETLEVHDTTLTAEKDLYTIDFESPLGLLGDKSDFVLYEQTVTGDSYPLIPSTYTITPDIIKQPKHNYDDILVFTSANPNFANGADIPKEGDIYKANSAGVEGDYVPSEWDKVASGTFYGTSNPVPPYFVGNLWYQGTGGDIKKCITAKTISGTYSSADWVNATKYGAYAAEISGIQTQVDKKVETFYQDTEPRTTLLDFDDSADFADNILYTGDLWYCTLASGANAHKTFVYKCFIRTLGTNLPTDIVITEFPITGTHFDFRWVQMDIPLSVFDKIDGKATIFTAEPSNYKANDMWILAADRTLHGTAYKAGTMLFSVADRAIFDGNDWYEKTRYTDDTKIDSLEIGGGNLVTNGDFAAGMNGWNTNQSSVAPFTLSVKAGYENIIPFQEHGISGLTDLDFSYDNNSVLVSSGFDFYFNGAKYNNIYLGSNSLITFGTAYAYQYNLGVSEPYGIPALLISAGDRYCLAAYAGNHRDNSNIFVIRYEGKGRDAGDYDYNLVWEVWLYKNSEIMDVNIITNNTTNKYISGLWSGTSLYYNSSRLVSAVQQSTKINSSLYPSEINNALVVKTATGESSSGIWKTVPYDTNKALVLSFYIKLLDGGTTFKAGIEATGSYNDNITIGSAWQRVVLKITPATQNNMHFYAASAGTTFIISNIQLEFGTIATAWKPSITEVRGQIDEGKYLQQALQGTTDIYGGLVTTELIRVKNSSGIINGGMSGIQADPVGFWTGGTYAQALAGLANTILRKDGGGQFAGGKIGWDLLGALNVGDFKIEGGEIVGYKDGKDKVRIKNSAIESLGSLAGSYIRQTPEYPLNHYFEYDNSANPLSAVIDLTYTSSYGELVLSDTKNVAFNAAANTILIPLDNIESGDIVSDWYELTGSRSYTISGDTIQSLPSGTYYILHKVSISVQVKKYRVGTCVVSGDNAYVAVEETTERSAIGSDGLYSYFGDTDHLYYKKGTAFEIRIGTYGLRVTASGLEKRISDSTGWEAL